MTHSLNTTGLFVDWLTISQTHLEPLPVVNNGCVFSVDTFGSVEWSTNRFFQIEGSHSSSLSIRCDGQTVIMSGNPGRFDRRENLYGHDFDTCLIIANRVLETFGLPPFTPGVLVPRQSTEISHYTGATVSRIDLTCNYSTGSQDNAGYALDWVAGRSISRHKTSTTPDGRTVEFGSKSKFIYCKLYDKFTELKRKIKGREVPEQILNFAKDNGLLRFEVTLKSRFLTQNNLRCLGNITMDKLTHIYKERAAVLSEDSVKVDSYSEIPAPFAATAYAWRDGYNSRKMSLSTYKRHRKALLGYGIDISIPCNVRRLPVKVRIIDLVPSVAPDWYWALSA